MRKTTNLGITLLVVGVLANNYIYLHDLLWGTYYGGLIELGPKSWVAIVVSLIVIGAGIWCIMSPEQEAADDTGSTGDSKTHEDTQ